MIIAAAVPAATFTQKEKDISPKEEEEEPGVIHN